MAGQEDAADLQLVQLLLQGRLPCFVALGQAAQLLVMAPPGIRSGRMRMPQAALQRLRRR